jgi:MFS superfamily sulfate permease-like transporter
MGLDRKKAVLANIKQDLPASIVVFFVAVPLCLGIALASGAPLFAGIIAGIVGGIVIGSISNSALGVSGPAAGLTVIVLSSIATLGSFEGFLVAVVLAGMFQIILGSLRAGVIGYYFPSAVIKGMLSAIGIIIIIKQIPHAIGYDADYEGDLSFLQADGENTFSELVKMIDSVSPGAIVVCLLAMATMFIWEMDAIKSNRILKFVQGPLVAVVAGIIYQLATSSYFPELSIGESHLVNVPVAKDVAEFFSQFTLPDFSYLGKSLTWVTALTIAIVASIETLLSVEATDKLDPHHRSTNNNRELIAQGAGNMISGLIGGLPITQVILRSSANIHSGAQTKLSTILHGFLLLICVATIPFVLNLVPLAVLAAILFMVGYKLTKPATFIEMYRLGWSQFLPFITTVIGVVFTDLLKGIGLGIGVAVIILLRKSFKNSHILDVNENKNGAKHVTMILAEEVYFLNKGAIADELNKLPEGSTITIDATRSVSIDHDVQEVIRDFKKTAKTKNILVNVILKPVAKSNNKDSRAVKNDLINA